MSKLRPIYVLIPGVVLIIAVICVFVFVLLPPVNSEIAKVTQERDTEQAKADERPQAEKRLEDAERKLKEQTLKLERYMKTRSIPISLYLPMEAMIKYWYELQEDLAPALEKYIESSGCRIIQGASLPAPSMSPPVPGPSNFIKVGPLSFTVQGTMAELRKLYTNLNQFERVATIEPLDLRPVGAGDELQATVSITVYILAEGPEGAAAAPAGGAAAAGPAGGGMPGGMPGMMGAPGAGPPAGGPSAAKAGGEAPEGGGAGSKLRGRDAEAGGDE